MSDAAYRQQLESARARFKAGHYQAVLTEMEALQRAHPAAQEVGLLRAMCMANLGQAEGAARVLSVLAGQYGNEHARKLLERLEKAEGRKGIADFGLRIADSSAGVHPQSAPSNPQSPAGSIPQSPIPNPQSAIANPLAPGTRLTETRVTLAEPIAREAWGEIWRAKHLKHGPVLVVAFNRGDGPQLFRECLEAYKRWNNLAPGAVPGLVKIINVFFQGAFPFFVAEDPGGPTVRELYAREEKVVMKSARMIEQLARTIESARRHSLTPLGFTPDNIFQRPGDEEQAWCVLPIIPTAGRRLGQLAGGRYVTRELLAAPDPDPLNPDVYALLLLWTEILARDFSLRRDPTTVAAAITFPRLRRLITFRLRPGLTGAYVQPADLRIAAETWLREDARADRLEAGGPSTDSQISPTPRMSAVMESDDATEGEDSTEDPADEEISGRTSERSGGRREGRKELVAGILGLLLFLGFSVWVVANFVTNVGEMKTSFFAEAPPPETAEATAGMIAQSIGEGDASVVWRILPASYQRDAAETVRLLAREMDAEIWEAGFKLLEKAGNVLRKHRDLILESGVGANALSDDAEPEEMIDDFIVLTELLVESDLADLETLRNAEAADLEGLIASIGDFALRNAAAVREPSQFSLNTFWLELPYDPEIETLESSADWARIEVRVPDQPPMREEFVRVEGKWIPKEMSERFPEALAAWREKGSKAIQESILPNKEKILQSLRTADGFLDKMYEANTETELQAAMLGAMPLAMAAMSGGGMRSSGSFRGEGSIAVTPDTEEEGAAPALTDATPGIPPPLTAQSASPSPTPAAQWRDVSLWQGRGGFASPPFTIESNNWQILVQARVEEADTVRLTLLNPGGDAPWATEFAKGKPLPALAPSARQVRQLRLSETGAGNYVLQIDSINSAWRVKIQQAAPSPDQ